MRTEQQKDRADKVVAYVFVAGLIVCVAGLAVFAVTGRSQPGVRIFTTAFWLVFAALNGNSFYTGSFKWKNGPTFTRDESPKMFYLSAISFAVGSMTIASFLLWAAYFSK